MIHVLDFDGNIVDFFSKKDESVIEAKHLINVQDDIETFDFTVISDRGEFVRERNRIVVEISSNKFREFIIIKTTDEMDGYTEVNCVGSHLEDISKSKPIQPTVLKNLTLDETMYEILRGTGWNVGDIAFLGDKTYNIEEHTSPFEVMKEIKTLFGHEYEFEVKIDGNKIIERKVNCVIPNSIFNGREIVYGKDLIGMTRTVDTENVVTAYLVIGPEYAPKKRLIAEVTDKKAQDKFGVKGDFLWGILEVDDEQARKGVPATTTTSTTKKPTVTTTTTKKKYTRATTRVVGTKTHTVRKGETLYTIAQKYNVTQKSIKDANKLRSTKIKVGQRLKIVITVKVTTTTTRSTTKKPVTTTTTTIMQQVEQNGILANLKKIGQREIDKVNQASLSYEITSLDIHKQYPHEIINIGDKVRIKNRDFKPALYSDARVIEIETDIIANEQTYKFGSIKEYKESSLRAYFNSLQKKFEQKLDDNIKNLDTIIESKIDNTEVFERAITKSENPPENPVNGTLWYDISNPDLAVIREYRDGEWVGATAEDISQIGGMTVEQIAFGQLMQLYAVVVGEMNGLENSYNEILESEYMDREDIKEELKTAYNSMQELFLSVTDLTTSIEEETVTMDELDTLNNDMIEYKHSVTDFYVIIEKAKKYIQEKIKILQSQYTEEKFNDAMDKVAKAIDGAYDKETGNLIANVPNQDQITKLIEDLKAYSDENDGTLKSDIENTITSKITDSETEFGRQFTEIEKRIDLVKVGGKNLLLKSNNNKTSVEHLVSTYDLSEDWTNEEYTITVWGTVNSDSQGFVLVTDNKEIETVYLKPNDNKTIWTATFDGKVDKSNILLTKRTLYIYNFPEENAGTSNIIKAKLEKGNKSTDWTPAPEDVNNIVNDIRIAISKVDGEVSATKDKFSTMYTKEETITKVNESLEPIKNLVNNNKSGITQLNESLKAYVKATDYATDKDNIVQRLSTTESGMEILSDKIGLAVTIDNYQKGIEETKKYTDNAIENINVGGRNLLENSNITKTQSPREHMHFADILPALKKVNVGDTVTISFDVQMTKGLYLQVYNSNQRGIRYIDGKTFKDIGTDKKRLSFQAVVKEDTTKRTDLSTIEFYSLYDSGDFATISNMKIEKGNIATDWTPAPEDLVNSVNNLQVGLDDYKEYISKSFKDTVITESEAKAIEQQKVFLESQKITLDNQYNSLYNNSILDNTEEKKALLSAKTNYETSYGKLIEAINSVIADGRANAQETAGVLAKFDVYKDNLGKLAKQLEDTNDAITTGKVKRINVGTRNLIDSMSMNVSSKDITGDTKELTVGAWAWGILNSNWVKKKIKSNTTYTISYTVELVSKPTTPVYSGIFGRAYIHSSTTSSSRVIMGELPSGYYETMKPGDTYFIKNTFTTPTLVGDAYVLFYNAIHGTAPYDKSVARFHDIMLVEGNVIGDYQRAPEDLDEKLTTMKTEIIQDGRQIAQTVSTETFNTKSKTLNKVLSQYINDTSTGHQFTYDENGNISSFIVGNGGIKINGDKVNINANKEFTAMVNTVSNKADETNIINKINLSQEGLDINVNKIGIRGGDATNYLTIKNQEILSRGIFTRTWGGVTDTPTATVGIKDGYILSKNLKTGYSLYMTEKGLSTMMSGGVGSEQAGALEFHYDLMNDNSRGVRLSSTYGVVFLHSEHSRIYTRSRYTTNIETWESSIYLRPQVNSRTGVNEFSFYIKDNDSAGDTDGTILFGEISDEKGLAGSGIRFKKKGIRNETADAYEPMVYATDNQGSVGTGSFYAKNLYGNWKAKSNNLYAMVNGEFRVTDFNGANGTNGSINYAAIRIGNINSYGSYANHSGSNVYFGVGVNELRITNNNHYNGGNTGYRPVRALDFLKASSIKFKKDAKEWNYDALTVIMEELQLYSYKYKYDERGLVQHGPIIGDGFNTPVEFIFGEGINTNEMLSWSLRAIQQLGQKIKILEDKLDEQKS